MSRADKLRKKRRKKGHTAHNPAGVGGTGSQNAEIPTPAPDLGRCVRPTAQRRAHGVWADPQGADKRSQPVVDMASDAVGRLHQSRKITDSQEQAARQFQELRSAYLAELPDVSGYKSCLAGSVPGFDDGDGDPRIIAEYRRLERAMTLAQRREVLRVCDMDLAPGNIDMLRGGLDAVIGA